MRPYVHLPSLGVPCGAGGLGAALSGSGGRAFGRALEVLWPKARSGLWAHSSELDSG